MKQIGQLFCIVAIAFLSNVMQGQSQQSPEWKNFVAALDKGDTQAMKSVPTYYWRIWYNEMPEVMDIYLKDIYQRSTTANGAAYRSIIESMKFEPQVWDKIDKMIQDEKDSPKANIGTPQEKPAAAKSNGYKTFNDAWQAINSAHVLAFSADNLFEAGISASSENDWNNALRDVLLYVQNILDAPRSFGQGISSSNKTLIMNAMNALQDTSRAITNTVNAARSANFNFKKDAYANVNVNQVNEQIAKLTARLDMLKKMQNDLKPLFMDALYTKDAKNILIKVAFMLELTVDAVRNHWNKLTSAIKAAKEAEGMKQLKAYANKQ